MSVRRGATPANGRTHSSARLDSSGIARRGKGDVAMVELLVEAGADANATGPDGRTALMYAAMFDRAEVVEALLRLGARADLTAADGSTALQCAKAMGAVRTAARLSALA